MKRRIMAIIMVIALTVNANQAMVMKAAGRSLTAGEGKTKTGSVPEVRTVNLNVGGSIAGITDPVQPSSESDTWKGCYLYYGKFDGAPVKYRILDANTTDFNSEATMFLDCDSVLEKRQFHSVKMAINGQSRSDDWKYSDLYFYLNSQAATKDGDGYTYNKTDTGFLATAFTKAEQDAIAESTHTKDSENYHGNWDVGIQKDNYHLYVDLTGDKIFILDQKEVNYDKYGYYSYTANESINRKKYLNGEAVWWWLRSNRVGQGDRVRAIRYDGTNQLGNIILEYGVSPAFNLKLSSILFTTASESGTRSAGKPDFALTSASNATEWVAAIHDGNTGFRAALDGSATVPVNEMIKLKDISGVTATDGVTSNRISAMLVDGDNTVVAYGKIAEADADQAAVTLPEGIEMGSYTLKVFSELANGENTTRYASNMVNIPVELVAAVQHTEEPTPTPKEPTPTPEEPTPTPEVPTPPPGVPTPPVMTPTPKPDESNQDGNQIDKRTDLSLQLAVGKQKGSNGIKLTWRKVEGCSGYEVYWSYCDGKQNYKKLKTVKSTEKCSCTHKKLKKDRAYKYYIATYQMEDGRKIYQSKSPVIHVAMKKEKYTNVKSIKVNKANVVLKAEGTFQIKATAVAEDRKKELLAHDARFRYYTDDREVITVTKTGRLKAKKQGVCTVHIIANNGVAQQIKVTVE